MDVNVGRLLLFGRLFGVLPEAAAVGAAISLHHDVFLQPFSTKPAAAGPSAKKAELDKCARLLLCWKVITQSR